MFGWQVAIAVAASAAILLALCITLIFRRYCGTSKQGTTIREAPTTAPPPLQNRGKTEKTSKTPIQLVQQPVVDHRRCRERMVKIRLHQPRIIIIVSFHSIIALRLHCPGGDHWEVGETSAELMQRTRMNPGLKKLSFNFPSMAAKSVIKTALPLPGPPLGNSSVFPQEAYFEITVLSTSCCIDDKGMVEGEKIKLIREFDRNRSSDSTIHFASKSANHALEERKLGSRGGGDREGLMMGVGLTCSSLVPLKFPGSYTGSIGFNSDGSVYFDGIKLVFGSGKEEWAQREKVIGCGFNPLQKKVFFTVDSKLAHIVNCKSEEFSNPLHPIIAANADITLVVNLGQATFSYEPANAARTPNPCFVGTEMSYLAGYEDSGELFSMGRIDSGWLNHCATKGSTNSDVYSRYSGTYNNNYNNGRSKSKANEDDVESEADLFEIGLDVNGRSPKV